MAGIYNIDWGNVGRNLTFWRWRNTFSDQDSKLSAYIRSVMASIQVTSDKLNTLDDETIDFLKYTGQDKVLEEFLNNKYDSVQRRIFITENDIAQLDPVIMGLTTDSILEPVVVGLTSDAILVPLAMSLSTEVLEDNNFTINIPVSVLYNESTLRSQLNNYVLVGKNYNIITF